MINHIPLTIRFIFLILICYHTCFISIGFSIPILKEQAKKSVQKQFSSQNRKITQKPLGRYNDITAVKQSFRVPYSQPTLKANNISAKSVIVIDAVSGKTIFSRSPDTPRQPASTIKVITGMIAIDALRNKEKIPVSKKAARQPRSKIYLDHRKTYLANDLINAVLLASANDASVALAEKIAGSEKSFAKMMTNQAKSWGARNTICKTASGLTAKGQRSTARDLATIFRRVMRDTEFASRMKHTKIRTSEGKLLKNHNKALWQIEGALAGKTGYTNAARQTYVGKFKRGRSEIIVAIMGSESMWTDIKHLVSYGFSAKGLASAPNTINDNGRTKLAAAY